MENNSHNDESDFKHAAEEVDKIWMEVEEKRPSLKFGVLVLGVAIGSYLGVGRHVVKAAKDVTFIRDNLAVIGHLMAVEAEMRDGQAAIVRHAMESGKEVRHFPGLGVWVEKANG